MEKLATEGTPKEIQIVLSWLIDTRRLTVALPQDKFEAWLKSLDAIISTRDCLKEALESLEVQLNHASLLAKAHAGISMNLIVTRRPDRIVWSDSCPFGVGGYPLVMGGRSLEDTDPVLQSHLW